MKNPNKMRGLGIGQNTVGFLFKGFTCKQNYFSVLHYSWYFQGIIICERIAHYYQLRLTLMYFPSWYLVAGLDSRYLMQCFVSSLSMTMSTYCTNQQKQEHVNIEYC